LVLLNSGCILKTFYYILQSVLQGQELFRNWYGYLCRVGSFYIVADCCVELADTAGWETDTTSVFLTVYHW